MRVPKLCESEAPRPRLERLESGSHLILPGESAERLERFDAPALGVTSLLGLIQDDISRRRLSVKLLPNAPPILLRGDAASLQTLRAANDELDLLGRALDVELKAYWLEGSAAVPVHPEAAAAQALASKAVLIGTATVRSGARAELGTRDTQSYVAGYQVEVATDAGVADPMVARILTGRTLHVRPCRIRGGRALHLEGFFDSSKLAGLEDFDCDTPDLGTVQTPRVEVVQLAYSGVVESGGWLAVGFENLAGLTGTVLLQASTTPDPSGLQAWRGVDLALLETRVDDLPQPEPGAGVDLPSSREARVLREPLTSATLAQLADEAGRGQKNALRPLAAWVPGYLVAGLGDGASWAELDALVNAAERERTAAYEIVIELGPARVRSSATEGLPLRVLAGVERTQLVDYDVHVAQESWMPSPRVEHVFDGLVVQGGCSSATLSCSAWTTATSSEDRIDRKRTGIGAMELLSRRVRSVDARVASGETREILSSEATAPALKIGLQGERP